MSAKVAAPQHLRTVGAALAVSDANQSRLAGELNALGEKRLEVMRIPAAAVSVLELVVVACRVLTDDADERSWDARLNALFEGLEGEQAAPWLAGATSFSEDDMRQAVEHVMKSQTRIFYKKLLGAAAYHRLTKAVRDDTTAVLEAIRRGLTALHPMVVAVQDSVSVLSDKQLEATGIADLLRTPLLRFVLEADRLITHTIDAIAADDLARLSSLDTADTEIEQEDILALAGQLRELVTDDLQNRLTVVNAALNRKMQGARTALDLSEDGPSQAANSMVELIDRLLREGTTPESVLAWVKTGYPGPAHELTYEKDGKICPTKRAEALFFAYGRAPTTMVDPLREASVAAILTCRSGLQTIKHADEDPLAAREAVEETMRAVHGALGMALRFAALRLSSGDLDESARVLDQTEPLTGGAQREHPTSPSADDAEFETDATLTRRSA